MRLLDETTQKELLAQYPEKYHELLLKQILALQDTIESNYEQYQASSDFRKAMHLMLGDIVQGKYLGMNPFND
jgi:hypothetical protein